MSSIIYTICMLFASRFIDWMDTKRSYLWATGVWSIGAYMHVFCGVVTEEYVGMHSVVKLIAATGNIVVILVTISIYCFLVTRCILVLGETGNFPAAIKVTAEYFPKKNQAYAAFIFSVGASIGVLIAPLSIPLLAKARGWEMAFVIIGTLDFIWMGPWIFMYTVPSKSKFIDKTELEYIKQDKQENGTIPVKEDKEKKGMTFRRCFMYRQIWALAFGESMTDGVWWSFPFWTPSYLSTQFGIKTSEGLGRALIFTLYVITILSTYGGKIPTIIINKTELDPYAAYMKAMLIFVSFLLLVLLAQPLGAISPRPPVIMIGIGGATYQSWSANIFSIVSDMFPKSAIASITSIGGMAGGVGSMILQYSAGKPFVHTDITRTVFVSFAGRPVGYFIIFCIRSAAYLVGWIVMKALVPRYKPIILD